MNRTTAWALGIGLAAVLLAVVFTGRGTLAPDEIPDGLEGEPQVRLVRDAQSGAVETMPMEEYIQGVVGGEMGQLPSEGGEAQDWPDAAYQAQAILARSFALGFLSEEGTVNISADVLEAQAYNPDNITRAIEQAVEATRGQVMVHDGEFVKAWFHSYSGGHTATAKEGLNYQEEEPGFIKTAEFEKDSRIPEEHRFWTVSIPTEEVSSGLRERGIDIGELRQVNIVERGPSGRATMLHVTGTGGTEDMHAADFRIAVGPEKLKSTLVEEMRVEGGNLVARGSGFGHGVGLSQWDAFWMAEDGQSAEQILNNFFQDIQIRSVWD